ncbi:MAG: 3-dehydroquinate synthase [Chloroflexi bacterium]|nr:3-dehydroquinate synthase [Chloroflexota bacterium]
MRTVRVNLGSNSYDILIGAGLLAEAGKFLKDAGFSGKVVIVTDSIVKGLHAGALEQGLKREGFQTVTLEVPVGEEHKSLETAGRLYKELSDFHAERNTPILALGGGVIGDLTGFVAATYLRGVPLVQVPTTLLAQVDSGIGGKVALDYGTLKNKIGAFYQPKLVIADIATLKTLPARQLLSGLAEVIKYAVIRDRELLTYIEERLDMIKSLDAAALEEIIYRSARIKAEVVEKDERDTGVRNILNYGHTIGHAIESVSDFQIAHGEAVAIGMVAAARISNKLGMLGEDELNRLTRVIERTGLPTEPPKLNLAEIIKAMGHDKKIISGRVRFVLPRKIGEVIVTDEVNQSQVEKVLAE